MDPSWSMIMLALVIVTLIGGYKFAGWFYWFASCHRRRRHWAEVALIFSLCLAICASETNDGVWILLIVGLAVVTGLVWIMDFFPANKRDRWL